MRPKHYVTVYLPAGLAGAALREAARRGIPLSRLLREALEAELARARHPGYAPPTSGHDPPGAPLTDLADLAVVAE